MALHGDNDIDDLLASWGGEEATTASNLSLSSPQSTEKKNLKKKHKKKKKRKRRENNTISFAETRLSQNCFHWPSIDGKRFLYLGSGLVHDCRGYTCNDQNSYGAYMCQYCGKSAATHELCISSSSILGDNNDDDLMKKCHPLSILSVANIIVSSRNIRCLISEHYPEVRQKNDLLPPLNSIAVSPKAISNALDVHTGRILITLKRMQNEILKSSNKYPDIQKELKTLGSVASISRSDIEILQERTTILISCMHEYKKAITSTDVNTTSSINILEKRLSAIIACDAIYYRCYYSAIISPCATDKNVNGNIMASIITHPPTYFSCPGLSWDVNSSLESLRIFLGESSNYKVAAPLDESTKQMILKSWGLEDRLLSNSTTGRDKAISNPLLTLWQSRFLETIRHVWCTRYSKIQSTQALGTTNATMQVDAAFDALKLHDTIAISPELSLWRDSVREYPANFYAYASPTNEALQVVSKLMESLEVEQIVEQGAGTGYWSSLLNAKLSQKKLEAEDEANLSLVEAYDISPPSTEGSDIAIANEYHGNVPTFMHVQKANVNDSKRASSPKTALLLCYPPPDSDMAYDALTAHINKGGQVIIHIGEWKGLTGNAMFEEFLKQEFYCEEKDAIQLPIWGTDATYLTIWRKKVSGDNTAASSCSTSAIGYCSSKNCSNEARRRCRYARCLQYCSLECYQSHSSQRRSILALHMICVGQEELLNFEDDNHFLDLSEIVSMKRDTTARDDSDRPRKKRKKKKRR